MSKPNTIGLGEYSDEDLVEELNNRGIISRIVMQASRPLYEEIHECNLTLMKVKEVFETYNVVGYVKNFKEAQKNDWDRLTIPIPPKEKY